MKTTTMTIFGICLSIAGCGGGSRPANSANYAQTGSTVMTDGPRIAHEDTTVSAACLDVPDSDQRVSPLASHRVIAIEPVYEAFPPKRPARLLGATVYLLASPGLTKEWLGHLLECHVARHAGTTPTSPDPLSLAGVNVQVSDTGNGFGVSITSKSWEMADRIMVESRALKM
jgi:hypothetical protein